MTHTLVLIIQAVAFLPYTTAFLQIVRRRIRRATSVWIALGLACDAFLGIAASLFSDLGENRDGVDWGSIPFLAHVILASIGMFGFLLLLILLLAFRARPRVETFARFASWVIFPCWVAGVLIASANVFMHFY